MDGIWEWTEWALWKRWTAARCDQVALGQSWSHLKRRWDSGCPTSVRKMRA